MEKRKYRLFRAIWNYTKLIVWKLCNAQPSTVLCDKNMTSPFQENILFFLVVAFNLAFINSIISSKPQSWVSLIAFFKCIAVTHATEKVCQAIYTQHIVNSESQFGESQTAKSRRNLLSQKKPSQTEIGFEKLKSTGLNWFKGLLSASNVMKWENWPQTVWSLSQDLVHLCTLCYSP